ncbi:MAG: hypothetical protein AAF804_03960 [Bacteroidota bacterium]
MQSRIHTPPFDLEQLIRSKSFDSLSLEERAMALTEVTAAEYRKLRETALLAARYLGDPLSPPRPRAETQEILRSHLRRQQSLPRRLGRLLDHRMPVWQAAAAAVVLVLTVQLTSRPALPDAAGQWIKPQFADSTLHDSAVQPVMNRHEDTVLGKWGLNQDTL